MIAIFVSSFWLLVNHSLQTHAFLSTRIHRQHQSSVIFNTKPSVTPLERDSGVIYKQSILTRSEFSSVQKELLSIINKLNDETTSSIARNRQGASLSRESETYRILEEGSLRNFVRKVTDNPKMRLSSNLPLEVRLYEKFGASMAWHKDDILYDPPQVEAVVTIENSSNCVTMWERGEQLASQETDPNSVLLLQAGAGGPLHCVTSLKRGRRVILKCAFASSDASFQEGIHKDQFGESKTRKKKRKGKKEKKKKR